MSACTFERRCIEQLRLAGIPPLLPVGLIPRIIVDGAMPVADSDDDGVDGDTVGVVDLVVPGDGDMDDLADLDDPRLLTAG